MLAKRPEQPPASAGVGKGRLGFLFAMATAREHVVNDRRDDQAQELRDSEPANYGRRERLQHLRPCANAKARGNIPQTAATAAIRMGRRRRCVASSMASRAGTPSAGSRSPGSSERMPSFRDDADHHNEPHERSHVGRDPGDDQIEDDARDREHAG
jgi:hypothetical protein